MSADDRVVDLAHGEVDAVIRYLPDSSAPEGALRLFGDRLTPVASPGAIGGKTPLRTPADLAQHVLLHYDDREGRMPMLAEHLRDGRPVAPFARKLESARSYFAIVAERSERRRDLASFLDRIRGEAARECEARRGRRTR